MLCQINIFSTSADSSIVAEFATFKAAWKGTGENKYFKIWDLNIFKPLAESRKIKIALP